MWLRLFMLLHVAARSSLVLVSQAGKYERWYLLIAPVLILCCLGGLLFPRYTLWATRIALVLSGMQIVEDLPLSANHAFLEFLVLGLLSLLDESRDDERLLLLQALRWLTLIFFFYTGFQKLLYGRYFDGQFLAYATATQDHFAKMFQHMMSADEFARLRLHRVAKIGAGPYRVDSIFFLLVSNGVYLFEMAAGALLLVPRLRRIVAVASILFVIAIEIGAREFVFGALMINLLFVFLPGRWNEIAFLPAMALYLYIFAAFFGWVPRFTCAT
jgi:hypothetical protein